MYRRWMNSLISFRVDDAECVLRESTSSIHETGSNLLGSMKQGQAYTGLESQQVAPEPRNRYARSTHSLSVTRVTDSLPASCEPCCLPQFHYRSPRSLQAKAGWLAY